MYDKPITIQVQGADEVWRDALHLHSTVNKATGSTAFTAGADQYQTRLTFDVRYICALEDLAYSPQPYRVLYNGRTFKVVDYDDYMERHRTVRLTGEHYV